jgi:hypothetical protein
MTDSDHELEQLASRRFKIDVDDLGSESTEISQRGEISLDDFYFERVLNSGQNGQVLLICPKTNPDEKLALKMIAKNHNPV